MWKLWGLCLTLTATVVDISLEDESLDDSSERRRDNFLLRFVWGLTGGFLRSAK